MEARFIPERIHVSPPTFIYVALELNQFLSQVLQPQFFFLFFFVYAVALILKGIIVCGSCGVVTLQGRFQSLFFGYRTSLKLSGVLTGSRLGGRRRHRDQVQGDFSQRRLAGQRLEDRDGVEDGASVFHLLLRPREGNLQRREEELRVTLSALVGRAKQD